MKKCFLKFSCVLFSVFLIILCANSAQATMLLHFDSSEQSWVGQGESFTVTPDDGYIFTGDRGYRNSLQFSIYSLNSPFGPDWDPSSGDEYHYWSLRIAAPYENDLEVGYYGDTARFPFQDESQPGLTFSGDHRGNNRNGGFFEILEILFDKDGDISKLAMDFTQFGEKNTDRWINGQLRFNSDIPLDGPTVPEPTTVTLFMTGLLSAFLVRRKYLNK
ncbi:MAG: PEP-CTERM sorting domain-containing protein [Desulfobacterales bacterium]|nr:PEP-CTERM sorting domain-containing protein [Desulfobacterales bacterium]